MASCECGCGRDTKPGRRFIQGHWSRTSDAAVMYAGRQKPRRETPGVCVCGCGEPTKPGSRYRQGHHLRGKRGPDHPRWRGGRWPNSSGYIQVYQPDHPGADRDGSVLEHRWVVEQSIGRYLYAHEIVHHRNGDMADNRLENLVVTTRRAHTHLPGHGAEVLTRVNAEQTREQKSAAGRKGAEARWGKRH